MKKKGFTLVELLGVIVVLAIIALIAVPTILGIIEKSRKGSLQNSGYGLVEAGTLYNAQYQNTKIVRFDIKNNEITSGEENKLSYKGKIKEGTVLINKKGEVVICINDGKYAAYKNFKDNKVIVVDNKTCTVPENSNIVYLDNEATMDTNLEDLIAEIDQMKQKIEEQSKEIEKLKLEKGNQSDITNSMNNLTSTHHADITLLNGMITQNKSNIDTLKNIFNGPNPTATVTVNLPGGVYQNKLQKTSFVATIRLNMYTTIENSLNDVIATLPEDFRPPFDCYVTGIAYKGSWEFNNNGTWVPMIYTIDTNGHIKQNFGDGSYSHFVIQATYPVQSNL